MPRYRVTVRVEEYWDYICEEESVGDATRAANDLWKESADNIRPHIYVQQVPDDTPLEDVG